MSVMDNEGHNPQGLLNTPNYSHGAQPEDNLGLGNLVVVSESLLDEKDAEIKRLRAALEFYASGSIAASEDGGKRAIAALRGDA